MSLLFLCDRVFGLFYSSYIWSTPSIQDRESKIEKFTLFATIIDPSNHYSHDPTPGFHGNSPIFDSWRLNGYLYHQGIFNHRIPISDWFGGEFNVLGPALSFWKQTRLLVSWGNGTPTE